MALTGISHLAERSPYSLSGGQQQRVALTSILVMAPRVLVLDDPTSQMDPIGTRDVFAIIKGMADRGMTVVMVEHKLEWVAAFADRVIALASGEVILDGAPAQVCNSPLLHEYGVGWLRYTQAAHLAAERGQWPVKRALPVTLEQAAEGFQQARQGRASEDETRADPD